jgi:protein-tyrosine-phosphatase
VSNLRIVTLCTGNAARSVMAGVMLEHLSREGGIDLDVATAGTHAVEGRPMSARVRLAMGSIEVLDLSRAGAHRSHQLTEEDCAAADLVIAMEADHVAYVRRNHAVAAAKTATVRRIASELDPGDRGLHERLSTLDLAHVDLVDEIDVLDPAGRDQPAYDDCAAELWELCQALVVSLG